MLTYISLGDGHVDISLTISSVQERKDVKTLLHPRWCYTMSHIANAHAENNEKDYWPSTKSAAIKWRHCAYTALSLSLLSDCTFILPITAHPYYLGLLLLPSSRAILKIPTLVYFSSPHFDLKTPFYMLMLLVANWSKLFNHDIWRALFVSRNLCKKLSMHMLSNRQVVSQGLNFWNTK